jgi:hypothetical protein
LWQLSQWRVSPDEIGLKMIHGPEESYATALLRVPIVKLKK